MVAIALLVVLLSAISGYAKRPESDPGSPYSCTRTGTVRFDGSGSTDPDGTIIKYEWKVDGARVGLVEGTEQDPPDSFFDYDLSGEGYSLGVHEVKLKVTDDNGEKKEAATTLTVLNAPPVATVDSDTTLEETPVTTNIVANDTDGDGTVGVSTVAIGSGPSNGSVVNNGDGTVTYTPSANFDGSDTYTYTVQDNDGDTSNEATVTITVTGVNDAPVVNDIPDQTIAEGGNLAAINLDNYVSDVDNTDDQMAWTYSGDSNLTIDITNRVATITPKNADWNGSETITFRATDPGSLFDEDPATFTVTAVNDAPVANAYSDTTPEDTPLTTNVVANDSDVDGTVVASTVAVVSGPSNGSVVNNGDGTITYTPSANFDGSDTYTYTVQDNNGATSNEATVTITVNPVNDPPVAIADSDATPEDTPLTTNVVANDSDVDGTIVASTVTIGSGPNNGSVVNNGDATITYTPSANFDGSDTYTYTVQDNNGATSNEATVTITVTAVNDPPVATADSDTTPEDTPLTTNVAANDTDIDGTVVASTVAIGSGPSNGSVVNNGDGTVTYIPNANFNGRDTYTYTIRDNNGAPSNVATVTIAVGPVNDTPIANDDTVLTDENTSLSIEVTINDDDLDGTIDPATIVIADAPEGGTVQVARDGTITYSPTSDFSGIDSFTYTVEDNEGAASNVAMVIVTVLGVNDPPIAEDDLATTKSGVPVSIAVLGNDSDPDGSLTPATVTTLLEPESGTATVNWDGTITYTSVEGFVGTDQFSYRVEDAHDAISNEATVTVEVLEVIGGGGRGLSAQEAMPSLDFLKHDTDDISWLILAESEEKEGSHYILTLGSTVLEELALSDDIQPTEIRAGAPLEVGLEFSEEERKTRGWPRIRVTRSDFVESTGGGAAGIDLGYSFYGRCVDGFCWLGIDTIDLLPGRYNFWIVHGEGKALLVPILVLP